MSLRTRLTFIIMLLLLILLGGLSYYMLAEVLQFTIVVTINLSVLLVVVWLLLFMNNNFLYPLTQIKRFSRNLTQKGLRQLNLEEYPEEIQDIVIQLQEVGRNLDDATAFIQDIGRGDFQADFGSLNTKEGLGKALLEMRNQLQAIAQEEQSRNWAINGIAKFSTLLRDNQNSEIEEIAFLFIKKLVQYVGANQGAVYFINEDGPDDRFIEIAAAYAYERRKYLKRRMEMGAGLVGRCIREEDTIYMDDIPDAYLRITSGLGKANPKALLLAPVMVNQVIYGAIELASFKQLQPYEIEFIDTLCQNFASTVANARISSNTKQLLVESQAIAKELKEKEEILENNTQELIYTQGQLREKILEVEKESIRTKSIVDAVNKTNAALELDLDGVIIEVNDIYLSLMEYSKEELLGKKEKELVSQEERESGRYDVMWESICGGAFNSGEFKRISKTGRELWITGTYSPILDVNGKPSKIVQFAQFTTEQKEKELEYSSKISAINESIPLIELELDGRLIRGNSMFMKHFGFKRRTEIRSTQFKDLLYETFTDTPAYEALWEKLRAGEVISQQIRMRALNGKEKHYITNLSPTKNLSGAVYKVIVTLVDVTELFRLREILKQNLIEEKRKNALLGLKVEFTDEFIGEIADILAKLENRKKGVDLRTLFKDKNIPVIETERDGSILSANASITNLLGS
ncbi:MAG: PAS domain-containing protein, partial [Bacteroidota bacterium]